MKALRYHGRGDVRLDEIDEPAVSPHDVKIRVEAAGICGSDIHEFRAGPLGIPQATAHPLTGDVAPVVMGHELIGTVVDVGAEVAAIRVGDRVAPEAVLRCGRCVPCTQGMTNLCRTVGFHGLSGGGGGFATYDVFPAEIAHVVPAELPAEAGALLEPLATGVHAVKRAGLEAGQSLVVFGAGPIGLMVVLAAKARGVSPIVVVEPSPVRAAAATSVGVTTVLNPHDDDIIAAVFDLTGGADVAIDAAGAAASFPLAIRSVRPRGTVVAVAAWESPVEFNPNILLGGEAHVTGSLAYTGAEFDEAIAIAATGAADLSALVTRRVGLEGIVDAFHTLAHSPGADIKVLLTFSSHEHGGPC